MKRGFEAILAIMIIVSILIVGGCSLIGKDNGQDDNGQAGVVTPEPSVDDNDKQDDDKQDEELESEDEIPPEVLEKYEDALIIKKEDGTVEVYESIISEEETPFVKIKKNGEKVYLAETSPEVIMLTKAVTEYGKAKYDIDWETAKGREEYHLLTPEAQKGFEEEGVEQIALDFYNTHKIKSKFLGIEKFNLIEINGSEAIVDIDFSFMYEEVVNLANYEAGKTYYTPMKLKYKLIDGKWLVDGILEVRQNYHYEEE